MRSSPLKRDSPPDQTDEIGFDPDEWTGIRETGQRILDDMFDYLATVGERPVWRRLPEATRSFLKEPGLAEHGQALEEVYDEVVEHVLPYPSGNIHPRFWSWVGGTGSAQGMLADLIAAAMNNCVLGFDEAAPSHVELQLIEWLKTLFGFPAESSGLCVSGGSMANLVGLTVARNACAGFDVRKDGVAAGPPLRVYASTETHSSVQKAVELLGLGREAMVHVPVDSDFRIDLDALARRMEADVARGMRPFCVVANAGTVNTGAVDPLEDLAELTRKHGLWLHVDGAFGALAWISPRGRERVRGLNRADSLAFDLHKWMYQQYDVGCVLVRDEAAHRNAFELTPAYLNRLTDGLATGPTDFSAFGVQLSRGFRAFRAWFTLKTEGAGKFRRLVDQNIAQAEYLTELVESEPRLQLLAPTSLNIVNFRYRDPRLDEDALNALNTGILQQLHVRGIAAPSSTRINGAFSIRAAVVNHRSRRADFRALKDAVLELGRELTSQGASD